MSLEEFVKIAAPALQALAILVTAIFAVLGLNAWRRQLVGKRRFEVAEEVLVAVHRAKLNLDHVRNPAGFEGEGSKEGEATLGRIRKVSTDLAELTKTMRLAEIHIGARAGDLIMGILGAFREVNLAATMMLVTHGRQYQTDQQLENHADKQDEWRLAIYGDGPNDDLTKRVDEAIAELERMCRAFLK